MLSWLLKPTEDQPKPIIGTTLDVTLWAENQTTHLGTSVVIIACLLGNIRSFLLEQSFRSLFVTTVKPVSTTAGFLHEKRQDDRKARDQNSTRRILPDHRHADYQWEGSHRPSTSHWLKEVVGKRRTIPSEYSSYGCEVTSVLLHWPGVDNCVR